MATLRKPPDSRAPRAKLSGRSETRGDCRGIECWELAEESGCRVKRGSNSGCAWKPKA